MKTFVISTLAAGLALTSATAMAQTTDPNAQVNPNVQQQRGGKAMMGPMTREEHRQKGMEMFRKWDKDGNGTITMQEFQTAHDDKFAKMDRNNDGIVSADEHRAHMADKKDDKW